MTLHSPPSGFVLNYVTWHATQRKKWEGIPATGRKAEWTVIIIGRFEGDKLAEDWVEYDRYNLFRQLGAF